MSNQNEEKKQNLEEVKGFDFRSGEVKVQYSVHPHCAYCKEPLLLRSVFPSWWPYVHVDIKMECSGCKLDYLFGIPCNLFSGLSLQVWDSNKAEIVKQAVELGDRYCHWESHGRMILTKIWGDQVPGREESTRIQWKCPKCFVTKHEVHKRKAPHLEDPTNFTEEGKKIILERLRKLGYFE